MLFFVPLLDLYTAKIKMAPIFATIGITPQIVDDERLIALRSSIGSVTLDGTFNESSQTSKTPRMPIDIERLVGLLEPWQSWAFEEQVRKPSLFFLRPFKKISDPNVLSQSFLFYRLIFKNGLNP